MTKAIILGVALFFTFYRVFTHAELIVHKKEPNGVQIFWAALTCILWAWFYYLNQ